MKQIILFMTIVSVAFSCKTQPQAVETPAISTLSESERCIAFIKSLPVGEPVSICRQERTSRTAIEARFGSYDEDDDYFCEETPAKDAFYYPDMDIVGKELARKAQLLFNAASVASRVIHAYELFSRATSDADPDSLSRRDTLLIIKETQPEISNTMLNKAIPDAATLTAAMQFRDAYAAFDGDDNEGSRFSNAFNSYVACLQNLTQLVDDEKLERFEDGFWQWYDKRQFVPEVDDLIKVNLKDYLSFEMPDEELEHFKEAVRAERDIDRRAILALEYAKFDHWNGSELLGEILESRIHTRYLFECWIAWRAYVQDTHGLSSFSKIPNNYYDAVRAICADTYIRHCLEKDDENALCLLENLLSCEILHRQAAIYGNESLTVCVRLCQDEFIDPRLLEEE